MKLDRELVSGSFILLLTFGLFNLINFIFQIFMARNLSVGEYGVLASLLGVTYVMAIFAESLQNLVTKYVSSEKDIGKIKGLFVKATQKSKSMSLKLFVSYLILSFLLSHLLKIEYFLVSLTGLVIFNSFFLPISRGLMQGMNQFKKLGSNLLIESTLKLLIGILLVFLGFKVYGAVSGIVLAGILAYGISLFQLKGNLKIKSKEFSRLDILNYLKPTFFITSIVIIFYSVDVILAKIFFSPDVAGAYAISSMLGKILFWGALPISKVLLPLSTKRNLEKKESKIFNNALSITSLILISILGIIYLFPLQIISLFSGKIIYESSSILFILALAFSLVAISNLILLNKLALNKTKNYQYLSVLLLIELFLLSYFSKDIYQFSIAFLASSLIFLWGSVKILRD